MFHHFTPVDDLFPANITDGLFSRFADDFRDRHIRSNWMCLAQSTERYDLISRQHCIPAIPGVRRVFASQRAGIPRRKDTDRCLRAGTCKCGGDHPKVQYAKRAAAYAAARRRDETIHRASIHFGGYEQALIHARQAESENLRRV